ILSEGAIDLQTGTFITCLIIIAFTALAGMVSIVSIDIFNGTIMIVAMALTLPFAIAAHGGWGEVVHTIESTRPEYLSLFEGHDSVWVLGIILPTFLLLMSESSMYQKFASAKDSSSAKKAVMGMLAGVVI